MDGEKWPNGIPVINTELTGERIAEYRRKNNIPVKEIRKALGLNTPQAYYKWTRGECLPTLDHLVILAELFRVTLDDLIVVCYV